MTSFKIYFALICLGSLNVVLTANTAIPFQLAGKLIVVKATVDGQAGNFILDTGISNLVLNARYFEGRPTDRIFYGIDGQARTVAISEPDVRLGIHHWNKAYAEVVPMPELEASKGIPIHGLLGTDLFRKYTLLIDFQKLEIELFPLDKHGHNVDFSKIDSPLETLPFKYKGGTPMVSFQLAGQSIQLALDSGTEINLLAAKYETRFKAHLKQVHHRWFRSFGEQAQQAPCAQLSMVQTTIGDLQNMLTVFVSLNQYNRFVHGPVADGILGYEFLNQFRVGFNFRKREMYVWEQSDGLLAKGEISSKE